MKINNISEYLNTREDTVVSPIWGGPMFFHFLCLGHLNASEALGFELERVSDTFSIVREGQVPDEKALERIIIERKWDTSCMEGEIAALRYCLSQFPDEMCGGGCFGPLTIVSGILGAENMLRLTAKNPEFVQKFLSYVTEFLVCLAKEERDAGAEFFWIAEPLASVISPRLFERFSGRYIKEIFEASSVPGILHVCGKTIKHTEHLIKTGAQVLSIDSCTDIGECLDIVPDDVVIMGNVSPNNLRFGTAEDVRNEIRCILKAVNGRKNFVLSTGCSVMPGTPDENVQILFE